MHFNDVFNKIDKLWSYSIPLTIIGVICRPSSIFALNVRNKQKYNDGYRQMLNIDAGLTKTVHVYYTHRRFQEFELFFIIETDALRKK